MTSKREAVLNAVTARIVAALPSAEVKRNLAKAERIGPGGLVVARDGDPGEPEVMLSPLLYLYSHRVPVEIAAYESATLPREAVIDQMPVSRACQDGARRGNSATRWLSGASRKRARVARGRKKRSNSVPG